MTEEMSPVETAVLELSRDMSELTEAVKNLREQMATVNSLVIKVMEGMNGSLDKR
jgi:hypothetical protein